MAHGSAPGPDRIVIDGNMHTLIPLVSMEQHAFYGAGVIEYPPTSPGWATAVIEGTRVCAWFDEAAS